MSEISTTPLEEKKNGKPLNLRHCEIVCDVDKIKVDIQKTCMDHTTIKQWAYINHDKDDTRPHFHIYLCFDYPVDMHLIAKWFEIPFNFIQKIKGRKGDYLNYMIHGNENAKFKHQYAPEEVIANFDWQFEVKQLQIIGNWDEYSYAQQIRFVESIKDSKERATTARLLDTLWKQHCNFLSLDAKRNMQVVFVCGKAGVGKTFYAQKICKELNFDYCISSASNDPFNDYKGQKAFIFDDMRWTAYPELDELLKILDNDTSSSAKSRFANVVLTCKLFIITTSVPLTFWYPGYKINGHDTLQQLYRRISNYVEVDKSDIRVYSKIDENGKPSGKFTLFENELEHSIKEEKEKIDIIGVFDKMCKKIEPHRPSLIEIDDGSLPF